MLTEQKIDSPPGLRLTHRVLQSYYRVPLNSAMNLGGEGPDLQASNFQPDQFFRLSRALEAEAAVDSGHAVDYPKLRSSAIYTQFRKTSHSLHYFDPASLQDQNQKLSFWINLYNVLILDAVIQCEVHNSIQEIPGFFWKAAYSIGGWRFSAHDIEHGILRANSPHPAIPGPHFGSQDRRREYSLTTLDPRIHFALNCASKSCPPISVYDPDVINDQLNLAARSFINHGGADVDLNNHEVRLSKIFQWYSVDFGGSFMALSKKRPLLDFVAPYLDDGEERRFALESNPSISFLPYDWNLNKLNSVSPI